MGTFIPHFLPTVKPEAPNIILSHYTSISTLAKILESHKFRFNSLAKVDDPLEANTSDFGVLAHAFLVSCWSKSSIESIPLWKSYGDNYEGCIIKMPSNLFENHRMGFYTNNNPYGESKIIEIYRDEKIKVKTGYVDLLKVNYSGNIAKYFNETNDGDIFIDNFSIVMTKRPEWGFQKEWRFILYQEPIPKWKTYYYEGELKEKTADRSLYIDHYDLKVSDKVFEKMEIIIGPYCGDAKQREINDLIKEYNPKCKVSKSTISFRRTSDGE